MKEKINVAELLKNCPSGMELDCIMFEGSVVFEDISEDDEYPIGISTKSREYTNLTKYGQYLDLEEAKCVIFPKGKTTWEGFHRPYINGDIVCTCRESIVILGNKLGEHSEGFCSYCGLFNYGFDTDVIVSPQRLATEEEKATLFDAIKENGYKWNPDNKTLEKLIEPKFKDGDVIFVVNNKSDEDFQYESIAIFKEIKRNKDLYVHGLYSYNDNMFSTHPYLCEIINSTVIEFANEEQREKLFNLIKINGYKWNEETKTLEDSLVEPKFKVGDKVRVKNGVSESRTIDGVFDTFYSLQMFGKIDFTDQDRWELVPDKFDLNTLVPFESKVLVRNDKDQYWIPAFWGGRRTDGYTTTFGWSKYCIPFDGNEHLLNSNKECDKFYRTWEGD